VECLCPDCETPPPHEPPNQRAAGPIRSHVRRQDLLTIILCENANKIQELCLSYAMELETVQNYIAASVNLDGVRSDVIKKALAADIAVEVQHAQ